MKSFNPLYILAACLACLPGVFAIWSDTQCSNTWTGEICVTVINHNNNATITYDLTVSDPQVGWAALGLGRSMLTADMVIMWKDTSNGKTIISQRKTSAYMMPIVDPNPPLVAIANDYRSVSNSSSTTFSFSVPSTTTVIEQPVVFSWSKVRPDSNAVDAILQMHIAYGSARMLVASHLLDPVDTPTPTPTTFPPHPTDISGGDGNNLPTPLTSPNSLTSAQRAFMAHGILLSLVFLVILPLCMIQARYFRLRVPGKLWFAAHWILQLPVSASLIIIGLCLAASQINKLHKEHLSDIHMERGLALICLYMIQCYFSGFIKPSRTTTRPQHYAHTILDLLIIALSFWQVYVGLDVEWHKFGDVHEVPQLAWTWWTVLMVTIPILYAASLVFLPRPVKVEAEAEAEESKGLLEK